MAAVSWMMKEKCKLFIFHLSDMEGVSSNLKW